MVGTRASSLVAEKHRNVARKIFLEGGRTQKKYSILDGRMSVMPIGGRQRKAQALPFPRVA